MYIYHGMVWFFTMAKFNIDETCFVVISLEITQTRSKLSNWFAIEILKIIEKLESKSYKFTAYG